MNRKIGLFGGTFNPLHYGHINLALELKERAGLSEIWFIPANHSPLRMEEHLAAADHRMAMLELALADIPDCHPMPLELKRPPPSYTIDTVKEILKSYPEGDFSLLLGEDSLLYFGAWKDPLEIVRHIPLLIGSRYPSQLLPRLPTLAFHQEIETAIRRGLIPTRELEISATEIRERIKKRLYCKHLLPGKVVDYIYENQLYCSSLVV